MDDDAFADHLFADMARLGAKPYAEVGVTMFLVAEDLRAGTPSPIDPATPWPAIVETFVRMGAVVDEHRPDADVKDVARLIEVLADRHLLASATRRP